MSIKLKLESATDVLDLDSIAATGYGYQALAGANMFGLPPVTVQWMEGVGDGATYRGRRVRSRDGDLTLDLLGRDRAHLKELTSRLAKVLSAPFNLVAVESDGSEWYTTATRTGGGGFQYGIDTIGETDIQLVISMTAGDPYFTSRLITQQIISAGTATPLLDLLVTLPVASGQAIGVVDIENVGDATAFPVWTVYGPGSDFQAVSPSGETLSWTGTLGAGEVLTLDTRYGTVKDNTNANRYAELDPAPRFWTVPPGVTSSTVALLGTDTTSKVVCSWQTRKWMVV